MPGETARLLTFAYGELLDECRMLRGGKPLFRNAIPAGPVKTPQRLCIEPQTREAVGAKDRVGPELRNLKPGLGQMETRDLFPRWDNDQVTLERPSARTIVSSNQSRGIG